MLEKPPCWKIIEWDMDNGDVLSRVYYKTESDAIKALEEYVKEAEREGWSCDWMDVGTAVCSTLSEEGYPVNRELTVEPEWNPDFCRES